MNEMKRKIKSILSKVLSDRKDIELTAWLKTKERIDLDNPVTFNEKIQWYKLFYHTELMTRCADKVCVREYVKDCGLEHILTQQYAVYRDPMDINFSELPDECFLKCNHNSAGNYHWKRWERADEIAIKKDSKEC